MRAWFAVFAILLGSSPVLAGPLERTCLVGPRPAASLLIPYFEVDLAAADGVTTLVSVGNALDSALLAHVVLWTDLGLPTLAFDVALDGRQVQSLNLRALLAGQLPRTGGFDESKGLLDAPSCTFPIPPPPVDVDELQARHTGRPSPFSGLCYGSGLRGPTVATGYLTVDVVRDCSNGALPGDAGYFDDGSGLATNDNALFGEFFLLDPGEDLSQGFAAVTLVADPDLFELPPDMPFSGPPTFYGPWVDRDDSDDRMPLSYRHRARFLRGGGFGGTTELVVWTAGVGAAARPVDCAARPYEHTSEVPLVGFELRDETGMRLFRDTITTPAQTFRITIGGDELPAPLDSFGTVDVETFLAGCLIMVPCLDFLQSWVAPLIGAGGRFSVGFEATPLDDPCD